jgi:response regulator RpfG family c-di-GMP phosphodiesterase
MTEKILIVEDNTDILNILKRLLSGNGYEIITASDGLQAVDIVRKQIPDLILLDIMLPGISGLNLLAEIKKEFPDTAVIMTTALCDADTVMKCIRLGAYDYFTKPFDLHNITNGVRRALIHRRLELENRAFQQQLTEKVKIQSDKIRSSFINAITSLALALEAKDEYTSGHSVRVSRISIIMAKEMELPEDTIAKIKLAGLLHDIGKIGIGSNILNKKEALTRDEYEQVKRHPEIGERILEPVIDDKKILQMVRMHHEQYNGAGYPDRLSGDLIPLEAEIIALADSFDAMTSDRPYRKAMTADKAIEEIIKETGVKFAADLVDTLEQKKSHLIANINSKNNSKVF